MKDKRELLQIPSTLSSYKSMANNVVRITFDTQENIEPEVKSKILSGHEQFGWLSFLVGEKKLEAKDILELPDLPKDEPDQKSPSQRLRARMFVCFADTHSDKSKFNQWYIEQLDKLGQQYLNKIDNGNVEDIVDEYNN